MQISGSVLASKLSVYLLILLIATVAGLPDIAYAQAEPSQAKGTTIFLSGIGFDPSTCHLSQQEQEFAALMQKEQGQQRSSLTCNPTLAKVAAARAADMAARNYVDHVNPDGYGPNYLVRAAGYPLPQFYSQAKDGNNVESLAAGYATAAEAWAGLLESEAHRTHLLGLDKFYAEQVEYGIAYVNDPNSSFKYYWVIITAKESAQNE